MYGVRICETVTAATLAELRHRRDSADRADLVELRLDGVADVDVAGALSGRRVPVVVTCRPSWDGGRYEGSEETRLAWLAEAVRLGAEFVDVEHRANWRALPRRDGSRLVMSFHDWEGLPADLGDRVRAMRATGASIVKVAITARRLADCLALGEACAGHGDTVAIAMGVPGQLTRICPWLFNSCWTYAGQAVPGQLTTGELLDSYRVRSCGRATALYGVAGRPIGHSASPAMHNAAFAAAGLDAVYVPLEGESADDVDAVARAFDVKGLSVTAPFKGEFFARAKSSDPLTSRLKAANTLKRQDGGWEARNFDVAGFLDPLDRRAVSLAGERVVVLGAGGAARAVIAALTDRGAHVAVSARRLESADALAADLGVSVEPWPPRPGWRMLVNATSVGTWPRVGETPVSSEGVAGTLVYDLVYNPPVTRLMREAATRGAEVIGGLGMLVGQACRQFEWWTGLPAPRDVIEQAATGWVRQEA